MGKVNRNFLQRRAQGIERDMCEYISMEIYDIEMVAVKCDNF